MVKRGFAFEFEIPDGWTEFKEENRYAYQGPNTEELIISGALIEGAGSPAERATIRQRLLQNALESVKQAALHPELQITKSLERDPDIGDLECWSLDSQTVDNDTVFLESVFLAERGVLLVTLEAPNTLNSKVLYDRFRRSVRNLSEGVI